MRKQVLTVAALVVLAGGLGGWPMRAFATPGGILDRGRMIKAQEELKQIEIALAAFRADVGRFPTTAEGLKSLAFQPAGLAKWAGPYMSNVPADPWDNPYVYRSPATRNKGPFELFSCGSDGKESGDDIILGAE